MPRLARDGVYKPNRLFGRHSDKGSVENDTDNEADIIHEADKEPTPGLQARLAALPVETVGSLSMANENSPTDAGQRPPPRPRQRRPRTRRIHLESDIPCHCCVASLKMRRHVGQPLICEAAPNTGSGRCQLCCLRRRPCIPVPPHLASEARRLLKINNALAYQANNAPRDFEVIQAAKTLSSRIKTFSLQPDIDPAEANSPSPGMSLNPEPAPKIPMITRVSSFEPSHSVPMTPTIPQLQSSQPQILSMILDAIRQGVEIYAKVNGQPTPVWPEPAENDRASESTESTGGW